MWSSTKATPARRGRPVSQPHPGHDNRNSVAVPGGHAAGPVDDLAGRRRYRVKMRRFDRSDRPRSGSRHGSRHAASRSRRMVGVPLGNPATSPRRGRAARSAMLRFPSGGTPLVNHRQHPLGRARQGSTPEVHDLRQGKADHVQRHDEQSQREKEGQDAQGKADRETREA